MIKYSELESTFHDANLEIFEYNLETNEEIDLPYLVYDAVQGESYSADGIAFFKTLIISLGMIDETLNFGMQRAIEKVLDDNTTYFDKQINYDDGARLYSVTYNFFVLDDAIN